MDRLAPDPHELGPDLRLRLLAAEQLWAIGKFVARVVHDDDL